VVRRRFGLLGLIYVLVGIYIAFAEDYIGIRLVKLVLSALLAIFLWPLVLLGVDLRIR
jgi:nicotinamide riboside transporter PnuC